MKLTSITLPTKEAIGSWGCQELINFPIGGTRPFPFKEYLLLKSWLSPFACNFSRFKAFTWGWLGTGQLKLSKSDKEWLRTLFLLLQSFKNVQVKLIFNIQCPTLPESHLPPVLEAMEAGHLRGCWPSYVLTNGVRLITAMAMASKGDLFTASYIASCSVLRLLSSLLYFYSL